MYDIREKKLYYFPKGTLISELFPLKWVFDDKKYRISDEKEQNSAKQKEEIF